ncbi:hypothetical protein I307_05713 [Cryptococcus deuterogattii 99/473]|uniref:Uncharacterized protein n=1 Tax=Cryptococcus deuterogattii Ram5 TaxID=1296110 RepID=A0A0D0V2N4_9TREE|nr:hypothetical protein I309_05875 [Cryptococcus deuterogattii LA55]KIR33965.1 hypothetical protein I352_03194 [Cryptococcus deuterogattii MMRL2647]KIR41651.1 hypothetical protein I313_02786 [Cryptococcus deuterogattii Ram5]KIR91475.1 hypothetical protein I304_04950 [Cryptococcus deuterogattii CBS 10090]KIR98336.1 hypothetical protein L804_03904 [Cryptococcus deuterogattii 2001/935-1]KIY54952.1 hypothetical protein I307_05713 [Cryptococcus deuterogattii 99/473]
MKVEDWVTKFRRSGRIQAQSKFGLATEHIPWRSRLTTKDHGMARLRRQPNST